MLQLKTYISKDMPQVPQCLWLKPVGNEFAASIIMNGTVFSLDISGNSDSENIVDEVIGSVQDSSTDNTIYGAKAYADSVGGNIIGTASDEATEMTLYGLKAYIDAQIEAL